MRGAIEGERGDIWHPADRGLSLNQANKVTFNYAKKRAGHDFSDYIPVISPCLSL